MLQFLNKCLENIEEAINHGQSRETGNTGDTRRRPTKQEHNTIYAGHHYTQANTNNVNKTRDLLQTRTSLLSGNRNGHHNAELRT